MRRALLRHVRALLFLACALPAFGDAPLFTDVTQAAGIAFINESGGADKQYIIETQSAGGGFWDYDLDGQLDIFLTSGVRSDSTTGTALYRGTRGAFGDVTAGSGAELGGWNMGVAFADYDSDGDPDLYLTRWGRDALLANAGDGTFQDATAAAHLGSAGWGIGAAFADYDGDGDLDLYVANYITYERGGPPFYDRWCRHNGVPAACGPSGAQAQPDLLYRNEGDGTFADASLQAGIRGPHYYGMGVAWSDLDGDGDLDLYVANDGHPNSLYRNDDQGRFVNTSLATGTAYSGDGRAQAGMGVALADFDNDLQVDIFVTNFSQDHNTLYRNEGNGFFADVSGRAGLAGSSRPFMGWGTFFFDYDHDGWQDLFVANGHLMPAIERAGGGLRYRQRNQLYRNLGDGRFREIANGPALAAERVSRGAAGGDYDADGDLDILVANLDDAPALLRNDVEDKGHWLLLTLRQRATEAIGAHVQVHAGGSYQMREVLTGSSFQAQSDTRLHFGLGPATAADIEITWPEGTRQVFRAVPANHRYVIHRGVNRLISE